MNDNFADVIESYLVPVEEGLNLDSKKAIKDSQPRLALMMTLKRIKVMHKDAKKDKKNISKWEALKEEYNKALDNAIDLKEFVDKQPEPVGFWERTFSALTPIFEWKFPEDELTNFIYLPIGDSAYISYSTKSYTDDKSERTNSSIKKSYQKRMNLFIVNTQKEIRAIESRIEKLKKEQGA